MDDEEECWFERDDEEVVDDIDPALDDCYSKFELTEDLPSKKISDRKLGGEPLLRPCQCRHSHRCCPSRTAITYSPIENVKNSSVNKNSANVRKPQITSSNSNSSPPASETPPSRKVRLSSYYSKTLVMMHVFSRGHWWTIPMKTLTRRTRTRKRRRAGRQPLPRKGRGSYRSGLLLPCLRHNGNAP